MRMGDVVLVSIEDHMVEPPDMFMPRSEWRKQNEAAGIGAV